MVIFHKNKMKMLFFLVSVINPSRTKKWNYSSKQCSPISERALLSGGAPGFALCPSGKSNM
jgi:hypothetical protein